MKHIAVVVAGADPERVAEALRAAVGLSLRGDRVEVALAVRPGRADPRVTRAVATLRALGHRVHDLGDDSAEASAHLRALVHAADAVEVWT
ncbi:hypothetical protein [Haliangium sp.]|uniref:hypothetical protein n=1 Tax=Haliangium sp. TaxID=2663208 RepID=UPI003D10575F